jgi:membrane protease YdiL (CAAX protease family)
VGEPDDSSAPEAPEKSSGRGQKPPIVRSANLFYGVMFVVALIASVWGPPFGFASAEAAAAGVRWGRDLSAGLVAGVLVVAVSHLLTRTTHWGDRLGRGLAEVLGPIDTRTAIWLGLVSGIAEELLFRGVLQPAVGYVAASLLFGLAHLAPRRDLWPWTLTSLAAGFLLGWLFDATGNLLAPTVTHVFVNAVDLRLLSRQFADSASP